MDKDQKAAVVEEIAGQLGDAEAVFAVDYRGITVTQAAELRAKLAEADASLRVVKNRLAKRAAESAGTDGIAELLDGPTALTFVNGDPVTVAKAISGFNRDHDVPTYKGGFMEGAPLDPEGFTRIARLPSLEVMHGQLVGMAASPLTGVTRGLASLLSGLASQLGQIEEKGLVSGEVAPKAEPAEPDAPAEDAERTEAEADPAEPDAGAEDSAGTDKEEEG